MRDALGGSVVLSIIVVFIVIALGYMAFNVNYTKAFRMKNKVISIYEDYDGQCTNGSDCDNEINEYAKKIGYTLRNMSCPEDYEHRTVYCIKSQEVKSNEYKSKSSVTHIKNETGASNELSDIKGQQYFSVITKINIDIPVINNVLDLKFFYISGDTKAFDIN